MRLLRHHCWCAWAVALGLVAAIGMGVLLAPADDLPRGSTEPGNRSADALFQAFPLYFIENRGQVEEPVGFYLEGREASGYFTPGGRDVCADGPGRC